ncbi:hypothetical protein AK812_SmicGene46434, partial [Symbiodinium microadriaticum]
MFRKLVCCSSMGHIKSFGNKKVLGRGRDSPNGREFYSHSPLQKLKWEVGPQCTQGIGGRKVRRSG